MKKNEDTIRRYGLGEKMLIGYRDDHTLFWLKTDKNYWNPKTDKLNVLEAGKAWIDEKSDTTILDFPTSDEVEIHNLEKEFLQDIEWTTHYKESDYYVQLAECTRNSPEKTKIEPTDYIDHKYDLPEYMEGYVLNDYTYLRKNIETGKLYYLKFSEFSEKDFENDRFGWIKAAREYFSFPTDEEEEHFSLLSDEKLLFELSGFYKESNGYAWIDEKNDVLVLGPINHQSIEISDNYYWDRLSSYSGLYSEWNQTQSWIDIESGLNKNPFNYRVRYFHMLEKFMG